jgi:hypothetical protein
MGRVSTNNGEQLNFTRDSGIAVSLRVWSETDVSGVIWSNGGHISSSKTEIMQVFLQREDGREIDVKINNAGIGAREGHHLSLIWASSSDSSGDVGVAMVNHSTGRHQIFGNRIDELMAKPMANLNGCCLAVVIIIAAGIFGSFLGQFKAAVIGLALLAIPVLLLSSISKVKGQRAGVREDYAAQIERYVADVLARET